MYQCCLCGSVIYKSPKSYWCNKCYLAHKEDIFQKKEWAKFLMRVESKRRRDERKWADKLIYLGDEFEVSDSKKLVRVKFEEG